MMATPSRQAISVVGPEIIPDPLFGVTDALTVLDQNKPNRCNEGFGVVGTITVNWPTTVQYRWERSDGASAPVETLVFQQAGSKTVTTGWNIGRTYTGWMRLQIISPSSFRSNQTAIVSQCPEPQQPQPPLQPIFSGSVRTSTDFGEARPGQAVRVDALLNYTSSNGPVHVEIFNGDGEVLKTCWQMSSNSSCQAFNAVIPQNAQGTYSFYSHAIDGAGNVVKGNLFLVTIVP
jgi:hypothetical protein